MEEKKEVRRKKRIRLFLQKVILARSGKTILDVGCGEGRLSEFVQENGRFVVALDIDENKLKSFSGVPKVLSDANRLPFPDKSFETVFLFNVIEHTVDDIVTLREAARVATKNLLLSVPKVDTYHRHQSGLSYRHYIDPTHRRYYTEESLKETLKRAGFQRFEIAHFSRVRPLLFYDRIGYPRLLLKAFDFLLWAIGRKRLEFYQTLFTEVLL